MSPDATIYHLTVATGHARLSPRHEVGDDAIAFLQPLLGGGSIPLPGAKAQLVPLFEGEDLYVFRVEAGAAAPLITGMVALTADAAKAGALLVQGKELDCYELPLLAVWLHAQALRPQYRHLLGLLGDLERCIAWAWLERP